MCRTGPGACCPSPKTKVQAGGQEPGSRPWLITTMWHPFWPSAPSASLLLILLPGFRVCRFTCSQPAPSLAIRRWHSQTRSCAPRCLACFPIRDDFAAELPGPFHCKGAHAAPTRFSPISIAPNLLRGRQKLCHWDKTCVYRQDFLKKLKITIPRNVITKRHPCPDKRSRQRRRRPRWKNKSEERLDRCRTAHVRFGSIKAVADTNEANSGELL